MLDGPPPRQSSPRRWQRHPVLVTVARLAVGTVGLGVVADAAMQGAAVIVVAGLLLFAVGALALVAGSFRLSTTFRNNPRDPEGGAAARSSLGRAAQVVLLLGAALLVVSGVATVVEVAGQSSRAFGGDRYELVVKLVGTVLRVAGLVLVLISQVGRLTNEELLRPFTPPGAVRGRRGRRHLLRQICGEGPYTADEVPLLRATAAWMLSLQVSAVGTVGLLMFPLGLALTPLSFPEPYDAGGLGLVVGRVFQVFATLLLLVVTSSLVRGREQIAAAHGSLSRPPRLRPLGFQTPPGA